jgi:hypothetical protein
MIKIYQSLSELLHYTSFKKGEKVSVISTTITIIGSLNPIQECPSK